jgi:hypothetical protein
MCALSPRFSPSCQRMGGGGIHLACIYICQPTGTRKCGVISRKINKTYTNKYRENNQQFIRFSYMSLQIHEGDTAAAHSTQPGSAVLSQKTKMSIVFLSVEKTAFLLGKCPSAGHVKRRWPRTRDTFLTITLFYRTN